MLITFDSNVIRSVFGLLLVVFLSQSAQAADIIVEPTFTPRENTRIAIVGTIETGDAKKFRGVLQKSYPQIIVDILSPGGDLLEAMKIGEMIRENFIMTWGPESLQCVSLQLDEAPGPMPDMRAWWPSHVPKSTACSCYSACFLIWSSGVIRYGGVNAFGALARYQPNLGNRPEETYFGIHRPRFNPEYFSGLSARDAEEKYDNLVASLLQFLGDMNVPRNIRERMLAVPSDDLYFLSSVELKSLQGPIPAVDEWLRSKCAHLSKRERDDFFDLSTKAALALRGGRVADEQC